MTRILSLQLLEQPASEQLPFDGASSISLIACSSLSTRQCWHDENGYDVL